MRVRTWLAGGAVLLGALVPAVAAPAGAAFSASSGAGSALQAGSLHPPTGFTATRDCGSAGPTFVTSSSAVTTASSVSVPRPAEVQAGDLVMVLITGPTSGGPWSGDGWTLYGGSMGAGGVLLAKIAGGTEPAGYTINGLVAGMPSLAVVVVYRGVDAGNPWTWVTTDSLTTPSTTVVGSDITVWSPDTASVMVGIVVLQSFAGSVVPGAGWTAATTVTPPGGVPGTVLVAHRPISQNTPYAMAATASAPTTASVLTVALRPAAVPSPPGPVELSWTPTTDTWATGYEGSRSDLPALVIFEGPRTMSSYSDTSLAAAAGATYSLRAVSGGWRSSWATATVPACG